MKAGICSYAYRWAIGHPQLPPGEKMDVYDFLNKAGKLDVKSVQICDNIPLEQFTCSEIESVRNVLNALELDVEIGMKGFAHDRMVNMISICEQLKSKILRIVLNEKKQINEYSPILEKMANLAESRGIVIAIENHFEMPPFELVSIVSKINSPFLKICLDVINSITFLSGYKETVSTLAPFSVSVHIKDVIIQRFSSILNKNELHVSESTKMEILNNFNTGFYISGCPLGEGIIDIPWIINEIGKYDIHPTIFIESWADPKNNANGTVWFEDNSVKHDISILKQYIDEMSIQ